MSWQRELEELDQELAAGRLSAEDYRRQRDELLARAAFTSHPQHAAPAAAEQADGPFPPPFRWEQAPAESPREMGPSPGPATDGTYGTEGADGVGAPAGHAGPAGSAPPWAGSAPPWAGSELPPVIEPSPSWMRQGPEVFESTGSGHRRRRVAATMIVAILLVGLVAVGIVYVTQRRGATSAEPAQGGTATQTSVSAASTTAAPTTTARQLPEPPPPLPRQQQTAAALIDPPGQVRGGGGLLDLAKLQAAQLFSQSTLDAMADGNLTDGVLKTTTVGRSTIGMYALTVQDSKAALHVIDVIGHNNATGGVRPDDSREQQGVKVYATTEGAKDQVYRAVYVLYDRAIELEVFGPDRQAVQKLFDDLLAKQLTHAPPTER